MSDYFQMDGAFQEPLTEKKPLTEKMSVVDGLIDDLRGCKNPIVKGKKAEIVLLKTAEILRDLVKKLEG